MTPRLRTLAPFLLLGAAGCVDDLVLLVREDAARPMDRDADGGTPDSGGDDAGPPLPIPDRRLAVGDRHGCAILAGGGLACWGENDSGQLGVGETFAFTAAPQRVAPPDGWLAVAAYGETTCALRAEGALYCWGANSKGQLGVGDTADRSEPTLVPVRSVVDVDVGREFVCALDVDRRLFCWGANFEGQLAQADPAASPDIPEPVQVGAERDWVTFSSGNGHGCGIRNRDQLLCWGRNTQDQLGQGDGAAAQTRTPTPVAGAYVRVAAAQNHTCAIDVAGDLHCWGRNGDGQLGVGSGGRSEPTPVTGTDGDFDQVAASWFVTCAIRSGGVLACWGRNDDGELFEDQRDRREPTVMSALEDWTEVRVGLFFFCARRATGETLCQGRNDLGQLGRETAMTFDPALGPVDL
ncbi:MAG: RCC1 domain-containing protein [Sandaracinaceae bacterium]